MTVDLDKSGYGFQRVKVWLGPSLGWTTELVDPSRVITLGGTYPVAPGDSLILVDTTGDVTISLPDVNLWVKQPAYQPATAFDRSITVKDFGGNAGFSSISIVPFGTQEIDSIQQSIGIISPGGYAKLTPLIDLTGWAIESGSGIGGNMNIVVDKGTVVSGVVVFDLHDAVHQRLTVGGPLTIAFAGWPAANVYGEIEVELINGGTNVTWTTVQWLNGDGSSSTSFSGMGVTLQAVGTNWILVWTTNGGVTLWGRAV